jgi:hypothetical protein
MHRVAKDYRNPLILVVLGLVLLGCRGTDPVRLEYQTTVVTLTGTLSAREAYGPPGYGEDPKNDRKERYWLLTLDAPISVAGNPKDEANSQSESNVKAVQVVYAGKQSFQESWLEKHVSVTGTLSHAMTGHHRTPVLIEVSELTPR